ncbi:histone-lysine N-methyltransferase SETMAR [Plakobranchus ocellatus]|uniref:Histone-lysine N-methyltransferase SETMAR n=1 Tax=Plakobranchus ocellatus TaxID=259542 RepID=A0AAV3YK61_9GAST|nr:histone-lysine N-methyltransferase SETMAR [Plakobranchus ocellatus]
MRNSNVIMTVTSQLAIFRTGPRRGSIRSARRLKSVTVTVTGLTLDRLKEAIRRKRPWLLRKGVVIQHDNATPHSANLTQQWLQRYGWEILPHPAHSPDLAPSDFHLFGPLKRHLGGMAFETEDDLISELRNWFDNLEWVSIRCCRAGKNASISTGITLRSSGRVNFNLCEFQIYLIKTL